MNLKANRTVLKEVYVYKDWKQRLAQNNFNSESEEVS